MPESTVILIVGSLENRPLSALIQAQAAAFKRWEFPVDRKMLYLGVRFRVTPS